MDMQPFVSRVDNILRIDICALESGSFHAGCKYAHGYLVCVLQGKLHIIANGTDNVLIPGDLIFCAPEQSYVQYADIGTAPQLLQIHFQTACEALAPLSGVKCSKSTVTEALVQQLLAEYDSSDSCAKDMVYLLVNQLLIAMQRNCKDPAVISKEGRILMRALQYIGDHVRNRLSVPETARAAGVSASYLTALFQKHLGISPGECIRRAKLQLSKELIREGELTFTQIAAALEYSTVHHFSRQFKEKFGVSPTQYANTAR